MKTNTKESVDKTNKKKFNPRKNGKQRRNDKGYDKAERSDTGKYALSSLNDISWYAHNPELLASASRFPFPYKPGMVANIYNVNAGTSDFNEVIPIPGVITVNFSPVPGYSDSVTSPISIAAKELYGRVRSQFSGSLEADAPDMMMYNLALDSIHMYIAHLKRVYRALSTFAPENRDYPDTILYALFGNIPAQGWDALRRQKTAIWGMINELVHMVNKFVLPKDMDLYERHRWMCEHVYLDGSVPQSQTYLFKPRGFWKLDDTGEVGTELIFKTLPVTQSFVGDPTQWFNYGLELIAALSDWEDGYTISGYYTRAFDGASLYIADLLLQDEKLQPVYVPEVLTQIENAQSCGFSVSALASCKVSQDPNTNAILFTPSATGHPVGSSLQSVPLNLHVYNPTGVDVTIASRLITYVTGMRSDTIHPVVCGTELVHNFSMYTCSNDGSPDEVHFDTYPDSYFTLPTTLANWSAFVRFVSRLSYFSHHPMVVMYPLMSGTTPSSSNTHWYPLCEIENFTTVDKSMMSELHKICVYSEFNCFR